MFCIFAWSQGSGGEQLTILFIYSSATCVHSKYIITITMYVGVLKSLLEDPSQSVNSQLFLEMQADILLIISCICELDVHRKVSLLG